MKRAVKTIADRLTETISSWPTVECIASGEAAEQDLLSPYFALILDVYYRDGVPAPDQRSEAFGEIGAFETSTSLSKDRFLVDGLPVRIEYKEMGKIERDLEAEGLAQHLIEAGTYPLHRLDTWKVLYEKGDWIRALRRLIAGLDASVWGRLRASALQKMEHSLADYGSAVWQGDEYFTIVSAAAFLRRAGAALFILNRRFEPSDRFVSSSIKGLASLPGSFAGYWESFLRAGEGEGPERKYEIARLIAKSILDS